MDSAPPINNMRLRLDAVFYLSALLASSPVYGQKTGGGEKKDKAVFESVCGACHPAGMVSDIRSEQDWKETVDQMIASGAKADERELESIMRYLLRNHTKVNVNTASATEIAPVLALPESTAQAIVTRRKQIGAFKTIEELAKVPGVDAAQLQARRDRIVF
jgi:competence ComEA-like helix-hairpin-helix protein